MRSTKQLVMLMGNVSTVCAKLAQLSVLDERNCTGARVAISHSI